MLLLSDVNFNGGIVRAMLRLRPSLDLIRAVDVGLGTATDSEMLRWAAARERIILTHDVTTMVGFDYEFVQLGETMTGLIEVPERRPIGRVLDDLSMVIDASFPGEWNGQVIYLPL